jgi:hypothetical protein
MLLNCSVCGDRWDRTTYVIADSDFDDGPNCQRRVIRIMMLVGEYGAGRWIGRLKPKCRANLLPARVAERVR